MHRIFIALAGAVLAATAAAASEKTDVMAVVHRWADGFNQGDSKMELATCADETSIIDDIAPHEWHGAGACSRWKDDYDAFLKKNEITDTLATVLQPRHIEISADTAYVVVPVTLAFKHGGKDLKDSGIFTLALKKGPSGWRALGVACTSSPIRSQQKAHSICYDSAPCKVMSTFSFMQVASTRAVHSSS
jgi:ketosteroid isomerase-like protein